MNVKLRSALRALRARYRVTHVLGSGSYGTVFRCTDALCGQDVAVKIILSDDTMTVPCVSESALQELRWTLAVRGHAHVVTFTRIIILTDFTACFVMKLYDCTLQAAIRSKRLTAVHARAAFVQLASAVNAMHGRGICHRDIKPTNVLLELSTGTVVVADLGIARDAVNERAAFTPLTGNVVTIGYAPMETLCETGTYGTAVDMWSLGVMLAELHLLKDVFTPCRDRRAHVTVVLKVLGIPDDGARDFLNATCRVPWYTLDRFTADANVSFYDTLRTVASEDASRLVQRLLQYEPERRIAAADVFADTYVSQAVETSHAVLLELASLLPSPLLSPFEDVLWADDDGMEGMADSDVALLLEYETDIADADVKAKDDADTDANKWRFVHADDDDEGCADTYVGRALIHALFCDDEPDFLFWHLEAWMLAPRLYNARLRKASTEKVRGTLLGIFACVSLAIACTRQSDVLIAACRFEWLRRMPYDICGTIMPSDIAHEEVRVLRDLQHDIPRTDIATWRRARTNLKGFQAVRAYCLTLL